MNCSSCQTSNPAEASFCMKCGASLVTTCPQCVTELPSEAQFCFKCGNQLAEPDAARASGGMQGERRIVTNGPRS